MRVSFYIPFILFSFHLCLVSSCQVAPAELQIIKQRLCDNFDGKVECIEPKPEKGFVLLERTGPQTEESWENFGNYLYFKARETPGFLLEFNRPFTPEERISISRNYSAYIRLHGVREKMEGFELGNQTIASFHYLGSLLKEVKRESGEIRKKVNLESEPPLFLEFDFILPEGTKGSLHREIQLRWKEL